MKSGFLPNPQKPVIGINKNKTENKIKADTVGDRIKLLLTKNNLSQKDLAIKIQTSESTISRYIQNKRIPYGETVARLADALNTTTDYILIGKTEGRDIIEIMEDIKKRNEEKKANNENNNSTERKLETRCLDVDLSTLTELDIVGTVRAGVGGVAHQDIIGHEYAYTVNANKETHFYLKVKGDSMEPKISEGDLALVLKQSDVDSGDLAIVLVGEEEGVIKKVVKKPNSIELHSFNPYYPTRVFVGKEMAYIKILGKVIKIISSW